QSEVQSSGQMRFAVLGVLLVLIGIAALAALVGVSVPGIMAWTISLGAALSLLLAGLALIFMRAPSAARANSMALAAPNGTRMTKGHGRLFQSVLDTVGNTPSIRVKNLAPSHVRLYVKAEFFNPAGSVKDRLALNIIEAAERNGTLKPGQTVVEATSGNTGIG